MNSVADSFSCHVLADVSGNFGTPQKGLSRRPPFLFEGRRHSRRIALNPSSGICILCVFFVGLSLRHRGRCARPYMRCGDLLPVHGRIRVFAGNALSLFLAPAASLAHSKFAVAFLAFVTFTSSATVLRVLYFPPPPSSTVPPTFNAEWRRPFCAL